MFCTHCGTQIAENAQFCSHCGNPTGTVAAAPSWSPAPEMAGTYAAMPNSIAPVTPVAYAGFWLRFIAYIIDAFILCLITAPFFILFGGAAMLQGIAAGRRPDELLPAMMGAVLGFEFAALGGVWLYYALFECSTWQGTPGKKILGLYVTDSRAERISFGRATGRYFAKMISGMTFLIGYVMAGFTARKQALHDMIADTLVLRRV
jgi:uncharacterized RDD family membrane protein YckC